MDDILDRAGQAAEDLGRLLPFLPDALAADTGSGGGPSSGLPSHRSPVNTDVLSVMHAADTLVPRIDRDARELLGEPPHGGDTVAVLRPLPTVLRRVYTVGLETEARRLTATLLRLNRAVRYALRLDDPDVALGILCPVCRSGDLVLAGNKAMVHVRRVDGVTVLDFGETEAIEAPAGHIVTCLHCATDYPPSQARLLVAGA